MDLENRSFLMNKITWRRGGRAEKALGGNFKIGCSLCCHCSDENQISRLRNQILVLEPKIKNSRVEKKPGKGMLWKLRSCC